MKQAKKMALTHSYLSPTEIEKQINESQEMFDHFIAESKSQTEEGWIISANALIRLAEVEQAKITVLYEMRERALTKSSKLN